MNSQEILDRLLARKKRKTIAKASLLIFSIIVIWLIFIIFKFRIVPSL